MLGPVSDMRKRRQIIGLWLGPLLALLLQTLPLPESLLAVSPTPEAARSAWIVLSLVILMAIWWVSEALPIPITSLLPMVILPLFGVSELRPISSDYMHPIVVLLMGGFMIAKAIERWNLHERLALMIVVRMGNRPASLIGGFMLAAALLSMWISNTATSIMMMPIAISVAASIVGRERLDGPFTYALLLGIAYACSIGGLGTPVGTPTNLIIIGYLNTYAGFDIGFGQWIGMGLPAVFILVPTAWFVLTKWAFKVDTHPTDLAPHIIKNRLGALGPISTPERRTLALFAFIAGLWILRKPLGLISIEGIRPFAGLSDAVIAIMGVVLCSLIPSGSHTDKKSALLDWKSAESIPWGVILLFGGGMALAGAITQTGLGTWIGTQMSSFASLPVWILIIGLTSFVIFATEVTSNIATAAALMPVLGASALALGLDIELLAAPLALAASCAFMLPMATGPNAVVYASGHVSLPTMARAGFRLNLIGIIIISGLSYLWVPFILG